jgi:hypothetical protein
MEVLCRIGDSIQYTDDCKLPTIAYRYSLFGAACHSVVNIA